jgi:hypothetical protein
MRAGRNRSKCAQIARIADDGLLARRGRENASDVARLTEAKGRIRPQLRSVVGVNAKPLGSDGVPASEVIGDRVCTIDAQHGGSVGDAVALEPM